MSENPFAPPESMQPSQATDLGGKSALLYCLTTSIVGGIAMGVSTWLLSGVGLLVMAFVTPALMRRHFMYAYKLSKDEVPNFVLLPIVVGLSVVVSISLGLVARVFVPESLLNRLISVVEEYVPIAFATIGFELAVANYARQERSILQILKPGIIVLLLTFGWVQLYSLLKDWNDQKTGIPPMVLFELRLVAELVLWLSTSILYSTIAADFEIRRRIKRQQVTEGFDSN